MSREGKLKANRIAAIDRIIHDGFCNGMRPTVKIMADYLEVSASTVQRDLDYLRDYLRAPLEYNEQEHFWYYSDPTFFVKSIEVSEGELFAMSVIQPMLEQYQNTPLSNSINGIFEKLADLLPEKITVNTAFLEQRFSAVNAPLALINEKAFYGVFEALKHRHTICFSYKSVGQTERSRRYANPLHIVCDQGDWYMIAFCHNHKEIRIFSLARISEIEETDQSFEIPADFKAEKYFDPVFGIWGGGEEPKKIELWFDARMDNYLETHIIHPGQKIETLSDGSFKVSFEGKQLKRIRNWVLPFGNAVKVLNPPELIDMVKKVIQDLNDIY
ncbi:MAG: WYL domain-containing protein [Treponema sp.]|nr:WYL domain-containing protein [Treponema sp.]